MNAAAPVDDVRVPLMVGAMCPLARSSQRKRALKRLPMTLSWIHSSPSASVPSAARQASFALVPVPQGERS